MRLRAGRITLYATRTWRIGKHVQWTAGGMQPAGARADVPEELRHIPPDIAEQLGLIPPRPMVQVDPRPKWRSWYLGWLELRVRC